jgi:tRNA threonylcarbamoyladenosine biosynthesis protein TsaB
MSSRILLIETSQQCCSVALSTDPVLSEDIFEARSHARDLLPMIQRLLQRAGISLKELDALAFGQGPGSFTGVRIAASAIQGLAYGAQLPVVALSSLAMLAKSCVVREGVENARIVAAVDARMGEVYAGVYDYQQGQLHAVSQDALLSPAQLQQIIETAVDMPLYLTGSAAELITLPAAVQYSEGLALAADSLDMASRLFAEGAAVTAEEALPQYLRGSSAWQKSNPSV